MATLIKKVLRLKRKMRIRKKLFGTVERPRVSVFKSAKHIYAQIIDDTKGHTLASIHSYDENKRANKTVCFELGKKLANICKEKNITKVAFDRNGFLYHGRIKSFADGLREGGVLF